VAEFQQSRGEEIMTFLWLDMLWLLGIIPLLVLSYILLMRCRELRSRISTLEIRDSDIRSARAGEWRRCAMLRIVNSTVRREITLKIKSKIRGGRSCSPPHTEPTT
jgi:hypothetical protein